MRACAWWAVLLLAVARARELDPAACSGRFDVQRDKIIRTEESREMGARYLAELDVGARAECLRLCCETDACDVFVFEEKSPGSCYLFACGPPEDFRCKFTAHGNFSSGVLALGRRLAERQDWQRHEEQLARLRISTTTSTPAASASPSPRPSATPARPQLPALPTQQHQPPPSRRCSRYQFECRRGGECIAVYNACDGVPQCADHSDEAPELGCPAPAAPPAPPVHSSVVPAAVGAVGAVAAAGAAQPDDANARELWPWRLTQAQRRYPGVAEAGGASGVPDSPGAAAEGASAPHIFSHQGGLLQTGALGPGWPRRAWPLGPPADPSHSAADSMEGTGEGEGAAVVRTPADAADGWRWPRPGTWPGGRRAWPVPSRLDPEAAEYADDRTMPELPRYAAAGPPRTAAPHDAPKKGPEQPAPPRAPPDRSDIQDDNKDTKKSMKQTVALERQAAVDARDGRSEHPPAAVLLLVLGTLMTAALGALLACRARAARTRRRAHPRLALDADYLVNGMYL